MYDYIRWVYVFIFVIIWGIFGFPNALVSLIFLPFVSSFIRGIYYIYNLYLQTSRNQRNLHSPITDNDSQINQKNKKQTQTSETPPPDDINNILNDLTNGEIKDPVTQEIFQAGETVYLCHRHRLAYHEDSWNHVGYKCTECGNNAHTKIYILPIKKVENNDLEQIQWQDIYEVNSTWEIHDIHDRN